MTLMEALMTQFEIVKLRTGHRVVLFKTFDHSDSQQDQDNLTQPYQHLVAFSASLYASNSREKYYVCREAL